MKNDTYRLALKKFARDGVHFVIAEMDEEATTLLVGENAVVDAKEQYDGTVYIVLAKGKRVVQKQTLGERTKILEELERIIDEELPHTDEIPHFQSLPRINPLRMQAVQTSARIKGDLEKVMREGLNIFDSSGLILSGAVIGNGYRYQVYGTESDDIFNDKIYWSGSHVTLIMTGSTPDNRVETYVRGVARNVDRLKAETLFSEAKKRLMIESSMTRKSVEPGPHNVLMTATALPEILYTLSKSSLDGPSFSLGLVDLERVRYGQKTFSPHVTLRDDPINVAFPCRWPADFLGERRHERTFIEQGMLLQRWYDSINAQKYGVSSTGHFDLAWHGPRNLHLLAGNGPSTLDAALKDLKDGILVTNMHYMNTTEQTTGGFTAFSRFGTYLVRHGKIAGLIPSLQFTDTMANFLRNVAWCSDKTQIQPVTDIYGGEPHPSCIVPAFVRVNGINVSGQGARNKRDGLYPPTQPPL